MIRLCAAPWPVWCEAVVPSPLLRYGRKDLAEAPVPPAIRAGGMRVAAFTTLAAWLDEIDRQGALMRPRRPL